MNHPPFFDTAWNGVIHDNKALCRTIMEAWAKAGHPQVKAWIDFVPVKAWSRETSQYIYVKREVIKSNLVNGLAPKQDMARAA